MFVCGPFRGLRVLLAGVVSLDGPLDQRFSFQDRVIGRKRKRSSQKPSEAIPPSEVRVAITWAPDAPVPQAADPSSVTSSATSLPIALLAPSREGERDTLNAPRIDKEASAVGVIIHAGAVSVDSVASTQEAGTSSPKKRKRTSSRQLLRRMLTELKEHIHREIAAQPDPSPDVALAVSAGSPSTTAVVTPSPSLASSSSTTTELASLQSGIDVAMKDTSKNGAATGKYTVATVPDAGPTAKPKRPTYRFKTATRELLHRIAQVHGKVVASRNRKMYVGGRAARSCPCLTWHDLSIRCRVLVAQRSDIKKSKMPKILNMKTERSKLYKEVCITLFCSCSLAEGL